MTQAQFTVFRVDASISIGTGHVMRCITLADALAKGGMRCQFLCRAHDGHLIDLIKGRGFDVSVLPDHLDTDISQGGPFHAHWLGTNWQTDAADCIAALKGARPDWLILDHYALDVNWEQVLRPLCGRLMVIDDLADRFHDCDILLDQNLGRTAENYADLVPKCCQIMMGPKYALLRPEFAQWRDASLARRSTPRLKHLLITLGGVDKDNVTGQVLTALAQCSAPENLTVTVIMGSHAPWLQNVQAQAETMPFATDVAIGVTNMAQCMTEADLCIGAAGSTSWERCCLGLPTVLLVLAKNQVEIAQKLAESGAVLTTTPEALASNISLLFKPYSGLELLAELSMQASTVTEGQGVRHVATQMEGVKL